MTILKITAIIHAPKKVAVYITNINPETFSLNGVTFSLNNSLNIASPLKYANNKNIPTKEKNIIESRNIIFLTRLLLYNTEIIPTHIPQTTSVLLRNTSQKLDKSA